MAKGAGDLWKRRNQLPEDLGTDRKMVTICGGTGCTAFGSRHVQKAFRQVLEAKGLAQTIPVKVTGCHGFCEKGPVVVLFPEKIFYPSVQVEDVAELVERTLLKGQVIERLVYLDPATREKIVYNHDIPFYAQQNRQVFRLNGLIDPVKIEDYLAAGGYSAMVKALTKMSPQEVIEEIKAAGLRGRGGAGFPTGLKWEFCRKAEGTKKYLICNADEGDPGAFMDRSVLEGTPHAVIEGMIIAAYAIGADEGIIYVREEYPLAVRNTTLALDQARKQGLLGEQILSANFNFNIRIRKGAGAFVCGEETALIASLEGKRGMPRPRPPFPAQKGYRGCPTNINNVETLANVPLIIARGQERYRSLGTDKSPGTKIFALAGKVNNTGLVEVPLGTTLRRIVFDIGGGIPGNRAFKAAQIGGPSGGCIPIQHLDIPLDYESVKSVGAIMGSGGLIIMDDTNCMVDVARFFLEFVQKESCGKCVPCRVGTRHMLDILNRITSGRGQEGDIEKLEELAVMIKESSLCGLGQTAPNPVLSSIRFFRQEYEEHIQQKKCRASVCEALYVSPCSHACPAGVNIPQYLGLIAENRLEEAVNIIRRRNPFVSVCGRVCDAPCELRCRRADVDEPLAIRALKRYAMDNTTESSAPLMPLSQEAHPEVAIIGSGPAGLSCAYFLALMGRRSVVFEALPIPGGMLSVGIPEYRLPKQRLKQDIDFILSHGVELRTNSPVPDAEALLKEDYKAVFIATGAHNGRRFNIPGEELSGVMDSLIFLRSYALEKKIKLGKNVVVLGGGNAAVDAARTAIRLGAKKVTILYRRTREEMPAYAEEIHAALEEGVKITELVSPTRIVGKKGRVTAIELVRMRLGDADSSGRRRPIPIENSAFSLECDTVIPAIGQTASVESAAHIIELNPLQGISVDAVSGATSLKGVFAGGDSVTGGSTVIEAIGAGQKAAVAMDRMLGGAGQLPPDSGISLWRSTEADNQELTTRKGEPLISVEERKGNFSEVQGCLSKEDAAYESHRCLRCDLERLLSTIEQGAAK